uniref:formyltransferase family protein n=1 Tax=uncultured Cloacibacillus sp. TaxID=889794 RepID=UPI0026DACC73
MINIVIIGNTSNYDIAQSLYDCNEFNIIGGIVDDSNSDNVQQQIIFLKKYNIPQLQLSDIPSINVDVCLIIYYTKIIDVKLFQNTLCLNIHAGILPKWRGFNANAWAIVNNENEVGYTLHKVTGDLDGGDIYYRFIEKISLDKKYGDIIPILRKRVCEALPNILISIVNCEIKPVTQQYQKFVYC